jgi:predicted MFS family arabinose efflux permease
VAGATAAAQATAQAALLDRVPKASHGHHLALALFASSIGFVGGPLLAAAFLNLASPSLLEEEMPFYYLAAGAVAAGSLLWMLLSEPRAGRHAFAWSLVRPTQGIRYFLPAARDVRVRGLLLLFFTLQAAWATYYLFGPDMLHALFGFGKARVGVFMSWIGVGLCVANGILQPFLIRRFPLRTLAAAGAALSGGAILLGLVEAGAHAQYCIAFVAGAATSVAYASVMTLMSYRVPQDRQGWILGIAGGVVSLAWGLASLASGLLDSLEEPGSRLTNLLAAALMLACAVGVSRLAPLPQDDASQSLPAVKSGG